MRRARFLRILAAGLAAIPFLPKMAWARRKSRPWTGEKIVNDAHRDWHEHWGPYQETTFEGVVLRSGWRPYYYGPSDTCTICRRESTTDEIDRLLRDEDVQRRITDRVICYRENFVAKPRHQVTLTLGDAS